MTRDKMFVAVTSKGNFMLIPALRQLTGGLLSLVYPDNCIICKSPHANNPFFICSSCQKTIVPNLPPFCMKCSRHLKSPKKNSWCPQCQKTQPFFDQAWAATRYTNSMKNFIHLFKYKNKTALRYLFSDIMISFVENYHININQFDYIVPIPLHPTKLRERQYNQTNLIAQELSKKFHIPLSRNNLIRQKHTKAQALLNEKERWTNTKDAFRIRHPSNFLEKSILIVDDLITTGATACEAAHTLKKAQTKYIGILTLAIA